MSETGETPKGGAGDSSKKQPEKFTRRDFLKLSGLTLGSLALKPKLSFEQSGKHTENQPRKLEINKGYKTESLQVGNMALTAILTEHDEKAWKEHGQEVLKEIESFPIIIPEYFPPEYMHLEENPLIKPGIGYYKKANALFDHIAEYALREKNEIRVLDPAYNEAVVAFRLLVNAPEATLYSLLGIPLTLAATAPRGKEPDSTVRKIVRATMLAGVVSGSVAKMAVDKNMFEQDLRRVLIAEALVQLGNILPPGSQAAIIYPPAHWYGRNPEKAGQDARTGIKEYIGNENIREASLKLYSNLKNKPNFAPLFETRHYIPESGHWKKLPGFTIET